MRVSKRTGLTLQSYQTQAEVLVKDYLLADPFIPYTSVLGGMFACKLVNLQTLILFYFCSFSSLFLDWAQRLQGLCTSVSFDHLIFLQIYDISQLFSTLYFLSYSSLTKIQQVEWNNRSVQNPSLNDYFFCFFDNLTYVYLVDFVVLSLQFMQFSLELFRCTSCSGQICSLIISKLA